MSELEAGATALISVAATKVLQMIAERDWAGIIKVIIAIAAGAGTGYVTSGAAGILTGAVAGASGAGLFTVARAAGKQRGGQQ